MIAERIFHWHNNIDDAHGGTTKPLEQHNQHFKWRHERRIWLFTRMYHQHIAHKDIILTNENIELSETTPCQADVKMH